MSRWLRTASGDKWHLIVEGKPLCGVPVSTIVVDSGDAPHEKRCGNCDREWRRRGRATKPRRMVKRDRSVYRPRFKFEDFSP